MNDSSPSCLIGVDGGGTSCRFALLQDGRRTEVRLGPANVTTDREAALATLRQGFADLAERAGIEPGALHAGTAHLGLAGIVDAQHAAGIAASLPFARVTVTDDRPTSVAGALGDTNGSLAAIGTGSFVARQYEGTIRFSGGWGFVLGDDASGAWLGRGLLADALRATDGLVPHSELIDAILADYGGPAGIVTHTRHTRPQDFATLSPRVFAAATDGDTAALRLLRAGAAYITDALAAIGRPAGEPLCLIGGAGAGYAPYLPPEAREALVPPQGTALDGALRLAARLAGSAP